MKLDKNCFTRNRTYKYLLPTLKFYGTGVTNILNNFSKLAVGLGDKAFVNMHIYPDNPTISLLINPDVNYSKRGVTEEEYLIRLDQLTKTGALHSSYSFILDETTCVMLVLNVPDIAVNAYNKFLEGKYSEMYTEKQIKFLFEGDAYKEQRLVFSKDKTQHEKLLQNIEKYFNTTMTIEDFPDLSSLEVDIQYQYEEEYF